jgi:hypothetical protein
MNILATFLSRGYQFLIFLIQEFSAPNSTFREKLENFLENVANFITAVLDFIVILVLRARTAFVNEEQVVYDAYEYDSCGLVEEKYTVVAQSGEVLEPCQFFVLRPDSDPFARRALYVYAQDCRKKNPLLAEQLFTLIQTWAVTAKRLRQKKEALQLQSASLKLEPNLT